MMMSGSISGSKGGKWTSQLRTYFYTENGKIEVNRYSLQKCVEDLHRITNCEEIQYIGSYRCPLVENIEENLFAYHQFLVIKTTNWYWSIGKDSEKILLQRSKAKNCVEKCKEGQARYTPVKMIVEIEGRGSMRDLIKFICENELDKTYDLLSDNCQHFAERLFNQFKKPSQGTRSPNSTFPLILVGSFLIVLLIVAKYKQKF